MKTSRELTSQEKELIEAIRADYFLFPRDYWKTFIGGGIAFLITVGVISWKSAKTALESDIAVRMTKEITQLHKVAADHVESLKTEQYVKTNTAIRIALPSGTAYLTNDVPHVQGSRTDGRQIWEIRTEK